ncbi:Eco47II family restriction endonuclease [Mucilaginibacter limnophilus]|uniref:Eco47II family restriction endonuclease n=1 Tax=Mucilaginibacter limnophilus TaxID=1932778 RepID=A0A437MUI5_9SPHI|nr:Eco47II family restriction endonuclease [Mucilaginibacter limnophilus]RVU01266.1 Eco47II family restriction endonuclease [Mucilaginibacter limnophilus]
MANTYLSYITDDHLKTCIAKLHRSYVNAKNSIDTARFYENKIDSFKLTFDSKFNGIDQESLVNTEMLRQIDKSINNFIGSFHEDVLGGIDGFETGRLTGYDVKASDNTMFAEIKNKHNTASSGAQRSMFERLRVFADNHRAEHATCYWVQILAKGSFDRPWEAYLNGTHYSHPRVRKISGDRFYALLSGVPDALFQLYRILPTAIDDYLRSLEQADVVQEHSALSEIIASSEAGVRSILDQIALDNYRYYRGFDEL